MGNKPFKPVAFKAKVNGKEKTFEIVTPKFIVPGHGVFTAEEAAKNAEVLAYLVEAAGGTIKEIEKPSKEE